MVVNQGPEQPDCIQSALTGHLVFTTVHATMYSMCWAGLSIWESIPIVLSPHELRRSPTAGERLCKNCAKIYPDEKYLEDTALKKEHKKPHLSCRSCPECAETGYSGRTVIGKYWN